MQYFQNCWIDLNFKQADFEKLNGIPADKAKQFVSDLILNGAKAEFQKEPNELPQDWKAYVKKFLSEKGDSGSTLTSSLNGQNGPTGNRNFALLTTVRTRYLTPPPILQLGSVVALGNNVVIKDAQGVITENTIKYDFYVCLQPLCDGVRLRVARRFPFLKLKEVEAGEPFDQVIEFGGKRYDLQIVYSPYSLLFFSFEPNHEMVIGASKEEDVWVFNGIEESGKNCSLLWVSDLKFPHAQRIAVNFAAQISRVGLTESEWLRRRAGKKND